jgi:thioredoxin reductase (NADPH)
MHELVIVGCGPAGLTAGIYAARYQLNCIVVGKDYGLIGEAYLVENYPGFNSIGGLDLAERMMEQLKSYRVPLKLGIEATRISKHERGFKVEFSNGGQTDCLAIIYAAGSRHRKLELAEGDRFIGRGLSYCATCDAPLYRGKTVAVVGGANSAASSALLLSRYASKVYILYRRNRLRCEPILARRIEENSKIEVLYRVVPVKLQGENVLKAIVLRRMDGEELRLNVDGVFVEIGTVPNVEPLKDLGVTLDEEGRIKVKPDMSTNVEGFFAAGNVSDGSDKLDQIVTAAAEGAIAATSAYHYLNLKHPRREAAP